MLIGGQGVGLKDERWGSGEQGEQKERITMTGPRNKSGERFRKYVG